MEQHNRQAQRNNRNSEKSLKRRARTEIIQNTVAFYKTEILWIVLWRFFNINATLKAKAWKQMKGDRHFKPCKHKIRRTLIHVKLYPVHNTQACGWNGSIAPLILNLGARWRWEVSLSFYPALPHEKNSGSHSIGDSVGPINQSGHSAEEKKSLSPSLDSNPVA